MQLHERVAAAIYEAVDDLAGTFPLGRLSERDPDALLCGPGSTLDSLAVVNLVMTIDQKVEGSFGAVVPVIDIIFEDPRDWSVEDLAVRLARELNAVGVELGA